MKISSALFFAFFGLFVGVFSLPGGNKIKDPKDVTTLVTALYATVQQYTGAISICSSPIFFLHQ